MILVKCSCGCLFTLKNDVLYREKELAWRSLKCQYCGNDFKLEDDDTWYKLAERLQATDMEIFSIPDDTNIEFSFR